MPRGSYVTIGRTQLRLAVAATSRVFPGLRDGARPLLVVDGDSFAHRVPAEFGLEVDRRWHREPGTDVARSLELEESLFRGGARRVIANSEMVKREAQASYGYPAEQIDVVPNGVPLAEFRPDPEMRRVHRKILRLREDEIAVLFVGSGWERKGLRFAIKAVKSLGKNFRLLVAGRGRRQIARSRFVQRLGPVRDLPPLYAAADLFLLPTLYDPFSNACLEALAAGLPVITTRQNGCSEIMEQNVHGTILDHPSDISEIRQALLSWSDPLRRDQARPAIIERASHFDISANVARTLEVLHHLAKADAVSGKIRNT